MGFTVPAPTGYHSYSVPIVVGAWGEASGATGVDGNQADNGAPASGAAYVFERDALGEWSQQAYLKASNTGVDDNFGLAVAIAGDTIVVGAHAEDSSARGVNGDQHDEKAPNSGAAYVFVRDSDGAWSQQAYLKASNTDALDRFAWWLGVSADVVVAGAFWEDSNATTIDGDEENNSAQNAGAAYVFVRNAAGSWAQQAYLKASNSQADDVFGLAVAVSGDTVAVGAQGEDSSASGVNGDQGDNSLQAAGAVYVLSGFGRIPCPPDLSGDGFVDQGDLALVLSCFNVPGDPCGDIDGDGQTTQSDLAALLAVYDTACP